MFLVSSCSCLCPISWSQMLSWKWRCSWSSADRWCSNYIWVIAHWGASHIRGLTVIFKTIGWWCPPQECDSHTPGCDIIQTSGIKLKVYTTLQSNHTFLITYIIFENVIYKVERRPAHIYAYKNAHIKCIWLKMIIANMKIEIFTYKLLKTFFPHESFYDRTKQIHAALHQLHTFYPFPFNGAFTQI